MIISDLFKILFININFRYDNSSGITVSKLVDHLPKENLFLLSTKAEQSNIDIFEDKYQIGKIQEATIKKKNGKRNSLKKILRNIIGKKSYFDKMTLDSSMKKWLDNINPDFIYFAPDSLSSTLFSQEIADYCKAKIIIHVMDDKVNVKYGGLVGFFYKIRFRNEFKRLVSNSDIKLSISETMASAYYKRYGQKFDTFHNPVDVAKWIQHGQSVSTIKLKDITKIIYSGWIGSTSVPIFEFCEVIKSINKLNYNIKFILYSKFSSLEVKQKIADYPFVQINEYVSQEELPKTLSKADFLFLPLSFEKKLKFIHLSMPSKTSEYMTSGVPVILLAPEETALSQYAIKGEWGHVITSNTKEYVVHEMIDLLGDIELQKKYSQNAIKLAKEKHDVKKNKLRFIKLLNEVENVQK